ncbi:MAG: hypothetical protein CO029_04805 [Candidatus Magasanikbacteria bacterium CG_4_9_14_0_2_um_filter_41_10]|uniref:HTH tetR-type domain-containing protein n=1 Tax=Candidatus Magasanikbacteria bacterium CG_4_10_14_0_2_um_filter_41_31 TaxID=1974639 RepID=A0A2M7V534_9BACT|nr:MAG: hypothetical protein AUJ37_01795 [Candidatus Magasanikbacteria bacterium CG1_02_41_34]PIZ93707.1 MAG: hypothetical protein COX83_01055 [Candidatus Magasanikbacteria bacterium CG_4_10_14_0_2_um_filter_41_31]PJC53047.1 MAG: hypothetical protein CO029_04805 [Candidatus Magasanikbacteria bacterium CG_4_9_14_0_2_um_filter_41_10]
MEQVPTTKEHIIAEAKTLFTTQGFAAISMSMIAKEVGISKAALYHFFENKAAIYVTVIEDVFLAIGEVFDAALSASPQDVPLTDVIEHVIAVGMQEGNVMLRMDKCSLLGEQVHMQTLFQDFFQKVENVLAHYYIEDTKLATHVFLNAVHGYIKWAHIDSDVVDVRTYSNYLATLFQKK